MPISGKIRQVVWARSGACCAICRERLLVTSATATESHLVGEVAHIVAEQPNGPRGSSPLTTEQRNQESNLLLLCFNHHKLIDDDQITYTVESLQGIRQSHLEWVATRLRLEHPWEMKLHNFYYINVPRLNLLAATMNESLDLSRYGEIVALHELGWELNGLMWSFKSLIEKIALRTVEIEKALQQEQAARGLLVSFDQNFRTKNIKMPQDIESYKRAVKGNIKTDPHIHAKFGDFTAVLVINPQWITTTTAFVQFRPSGGKGKFTGIGIVNSCDSDTKILSITPLLVGLPSNSFMDAFNGNT